VKKTLRKKENPGSHHRGEQRGRQQNRNDEKKTKTKTFKQGKKKNNTVAEMKGSPFV